MSDDDLTLSGYSSGREPSGGPFKRKAPAEEHRQARRQVFLRARRARRAKPIAALLIVGVAVFCIAFAFAPLFAFRAVRSAAQFQDVQALDQSVDYEAVRQSLRVQVRPASVEAQPPSNVLRDPLGALRRAWEPATPQGDVNAFLTPAALAALMSGLPPEEQAPAPEGLFGGSVPRLRYWGFERARFGVLNPERTSRETVFTFQRQGLFTWKLVGVRLPPALAAIQVETQ